MIDDLDLRLRTRLDRLAQAVPLGASTASAPSSEAVGRPRPVARLSSGTLAFATTALLVVIAVIALAGPGKTPTTGAASPPAGVASPSASGSAAGSPETTAVTADIDCVGITTESCRQAIGLVGDTHPREVAEAMAIVVADVCAPDVLCDRRYPFDSIVVLVPPAGASWAQLAVKVVGIDGPERVEPRTGALPQHVEAHLPTPSMPPAGVAVPYPAGCGVYHLSPRRCDYIVAWAMQQAGDPEATDVTVQLLGDPECPEGTRTCNVDRTQSFVVRVRLITAGGATRDESVFCGIGGDASLLCTESPVIRRSSPTMAGYTDIPCAGVAPQSPCASPVPSPDPSALAAATMLRVGQLSIPIDHVGAYAIPVGEALLPNGVLREAAFELRNDTPADFLVSPEGVSLMIESLDGGSPFDNIYAHGWHPGTERVKATLVFAVESFEPGAVLEATGITVR